MSDTHGTHVSDEHAAPDGHAAANGHGHDEHGAPHAAPDGHAPDGHGDEALGPIDWRMWGVGVLGVIAALIVTAGFVVATGFAFNA